MAKSTAPLMDSTNETLYREIYQSLNQNTDYFEQKIKVFKVKKIEGKQKIDKDNNPVVNEFGEFEKWDDSYVVTFVALNSGGEHTTRITQEQYLDLKEDEVYIASGKIEYRLYKDAYNSTPVVVFNKFVPAIDSFVTAMLKMESIKNDSNA
ncbi:hypothetical protein [Campylobacter concisus]|uniref:hypothetical protein n=1 Tax=Campylobacter concisus TaxID=199 RepID=UPI000CD9FA07|nr:hypothetical protein [Campylobacter concisus]